MNNQVTKELLLAGWRDRGERFLSRRELAESWSLSVRDEREKRGLLPHYRFSYKTTRFKLSDVVALEEAAKV